MLTGALLRQGLQRLRDRNVPVSVRFWDGSDYHPDGDATVRLVLHRPAALRALARPSLGRLARAYVEQQLDIEGSLREVLRVGEQLCDAANAVDMRGSPSLAWLRHARPATRRQIGYHYDVSNDFYALWLDSRRVYSCAYFRRPEDSLDQAQENKLDLICRKLMLQPGERLLDIGCGWGGLLFWAAEHYNANCLGVTLSEGQFAYVQEEIRRRGLEGRVEVRLQDYRDLAQEGAFDKIASVGMFEHVGRGLLTAYFARIAALLKPGGLVLNHGITAGAPDTKGLRSDIAGFVEQYVFPGGELEHVSRVLETLALGGLECVDVESLRPHYSRTLWHWVDRLEARAEEARALAGEKRLRIWRIYMAGAAHAFSRGWISVFQILAGRPLPDGSLPYPYTRLHLLPALSPGDS